MFRYKSKYRKVGVLPIRIVESNVSSIGPSSERNRKAFLFLSDEGLLLETLDYTIRIGSTPTLLIKIHVLYILDYVQKFFKWLHARSPGV